MTHPTCVCGGHPGCELDSAAERPEALGAAGGGAAATSVLTRRAVSRRGVLAGSAAVVAGMALAGCSSTPDSDTGTAPTPTPTPAETDAAEPTAGRDRRLTRRAVGRNVRRGRGWGRGARGVIRARRDPDPPRGRPVRGVRRTMPARRVPDVPGRQQHHHVQLSQEHVRRRDRGPSGRAGADGPHAGEHHRGGRCGLPLVAPGRRSGRRPGRSRTSLGCIASATPTAG